MGIYNVDEKEEAAEVAGKREKGGGAWPCPRDHNQHRRSKSASDRKFDASRRGVLPSSKKDQSETHVSILSTKTFGAQSPLRGHPTTHVNTNVSATDRASLETDIEQLQLRLQQEKAMRLTLERAMGRASSTLSPGHRHFASQTKELIAEIELLEEEVANREQKVLSLYRSIFENCVSRPPSEQSSVVASPIHTKHESRKHPSIISSSFCSSKNFTLRPLQALASINNSRKKASTSSHPSLYSGQSNIQFEKTCSDPVKVQEKVPSDKTSLLHPLKDHLYPCPNKLSEDMVRCMVSVYCWLRSAPSVNPKKNQSDSPSKSSTNVVLPKHSTGEDRDRSCKSVVEVSWISTDKGHFSRASYAINNYRVLVEQLERVNVTQMESNGQIAFWINVYNSLVMHAYLAYGIPQSSLRRLALFHKAAYNIGGHVISANAIEQSIFCFRTPRNGRWLETILSTALRKKPGEEAQLVSTKFGLPNPQSLVCFSLCTGAVSDPVLHVYTESNIEEELDTAKREFLQANISVKKSKKMLLPKVVERFAKEASIASNDLLEWVTENVDKKLADSIQNCIGHKTNKKASQVIEWLPYSSKFGYMFSKDLTEEPLRG